MREKLLSTGLFLENEYFENYIELINSNLTTKKQSFKTQRHHIIPAAVFKLKKWSDKDNKQNLVNLLYKDHILAHYFLALCSKDEELSYKMYCALNFILGKIKQNNTDMLEFNKFLNSLPKYQEIYERSKRQLANKRQGTTHSTANETKAKISAVNKGRVYINKDNVVKSINPKDLELFLDAGWVRGNPNSAKRNTRKGCTIVHKNNIEKYIEKADLNKYLAEGWARGRSTAHKLASKVGTKSYFDSLSEMEKIKKYGTYGHLGINCSDETKQKISKANLGKKISAEHKLKISQQMKGKIHMTNGTKDIMIFPDQEQEFILLGYYRGRSALKNKKERRGDQILAD